MREKPHMGRIERWFKVECLGGGDINLGYCIVGYALDHPIYACDPPRTFHTSYVVKHDATNGEIETNNSRYTLVGPEIKEMTALHRGEA